MSLPDEGSIGVHARTAVPQGQRTQLALTPAQKAVATDSLGYRTGPARPDGFEAAFEPSEVILSAP